MTPKRQRRQLDVLELPSAQVCVLCWLKYRACASPFEELTRGLQGCWLLLTRSVTVQRLFFFLAAAVTQYGLQVCWSRVSSQIIGRVISDQRSAILCTLCFCMSSTPANTTIQLVKWAAWPGGQRCHCKLEVPPVLVWSRSKYSNNDPSISFAGRH